MFWVFIVLVFFILMSVFIALIAQAYESAREELHSLEVNAITRTPALGETDKMARDTLLAKKSLRDMKMKKMVSEPLAYSLREPLKAVEVALAHEGTLLELAQPTNCSEMVMQNLSRCKHERALFKLRRSTKNIIAINRMMNSTDGLADEPTAPDAIATADSGLFLSHPVDTFTDDDDDPAFDELKDLFVSQPPTHIQTHTQWPAHVLHRRCELRRLSGMRN